MPLWFSSNALVVSHLALYFPSCTCTYRMCPVSVPLWLLLLLCGCVLAPSPSGVELKPRVTPLRSSFDKGQRSRVQTLKHPLCLRIGDWRSLLPAGCIRPIARVDSIAYILHPSNDYSS